jgi:predicted O-methyltransferase YrrM
MKKTVWHDIQLSVRHTGDLWSLYRTKKNNEVAYYNLLFALACGVLPTTILELGTGPGVSSLAFIRVLQYCSAAWKRNCHLHTCDVDPNAIKPLLRYEPLVVPHVKQTDELAVEWATHRTPIDILYIDAAHSHEQSLADFQNFSPYVLPNGLILMHDVHPLTPEHEDLRFSGTVYKTALFLKANYAHEFEYVTYPHLSGIGLLRRKGGRYF